MQQAYISEAVAVGNWIIIGYKGPGEQTAPGNATGGTASKTTNFTYADGTGFVKNTADLGTTAKVGFTATSAANLNDCTSQNTWTVGVKKGGSAGEASFEAAGSAMSNQGCIALTPNFDKIGK